MTTILQEVNDRVLNAVEANFDAQIEFLSELIRYPSLRGQETAVQEFVEAALLSRGFEVDRLPIDPALIGRHPAFSPATMDLSGSWNLIGSRNPPEIQGRSLILNAHVDVVPAGDPVRWQHPPFAATRIGDWLYGRGAGDMKAGLSAAIFALDAIDAAGLKLAAPVQIHSVIEEEITGNGAAMALADGRVADAVLIAEPTDERLVRANSGVIKFAVTVYGIPAHPREVSGGASAIESAMRLINLLKKLELQWNAEQAAHPLFNDVENPAALTIGTISGGEWIASVPSSCRFEGRIGFYPGDNPQSRAREFEEFIVSTIAEDPLLSRGPAPTVEWVGVMHAGYALAPGSDAEAVLADAHRQADHTRHQPLESYVMACYLDAAVYSVHGGIPSLVYGPVTENIHAADERVSLSSLLRTTKTIALFAASWCGVRAKAGAGEAHDR